MKVTHLTINLLKDGNDYDVLSGFYVEQPENFLLEKVSHRTGNHVFVKWLGIDSKHNYWIHLN